MTATPDILPEDGTSQAVISIAVRDANAQPLANVQLRVDASEGQLSAGTVVTGSDGRASVTYGTAHDDAGIRSGKIGSRGGSRGKQLSERPATTVWIRLVPPSVIRRRRALFADFDFLAAVAEDQRGRRSSARRRSTPTDRSWSMRLELGRQRERGQTFQPRRP